MKAVIQKSQGGGFTLLNGNFDGALAGIHVKLCLSAIPHLPFKGLPHESHDIGQFIKRCEANLDFPVTQTTNAGHIPATVSGIVYLGKSHIKRQT
ncbi:MAG: hypothetical protein IT491_06865 [Gammaproteobacteria bacterium]|nr:hypothetical protein [Gammaproteobacteria bacterium]